MPSFSSSESIRPLSGRMPQSPRPSLPVGGRTLRNCALSLVVLLGAAGCGDDPTPASGPNLRCGDSYPELGPDGLLLGSRCPGAAMRLLPWVKADGVWRGGTEGGDCTVDGDRLVCEVAGVGNLYLRAEPPLLEVELAATENVTVEGLLIDGVLSLDGATSWLSDGFHSWSQSGMIAIGDEIADEDLDEVLRSRGNDEVLRLGDAQSWTYTMIGGGADSLVVGALSAARLKPWLRVERLDEALLRVRIGAGATGESIALSAGDRLAGEPFFYSFSTDAHGALTEYSEHLPARRPTTAPVPPAIAGWNSWYELWDGVSEADIRESAPIAREILEPRVGVDTPLQIVVDDGWEERWGDWLPNDRFPSGMDELAADLKTDGFVPGIWIAPLLVSEDSALVTEHPDWFVRDVTHSPGLNGRMLVLDVTQPDAAEHLRSLIQRLVGWGYELLKVDYLFSGTFEGPRYEDVTGMEAYARALSIVREAAGDDVTLLLVGAPGLASLPYADAWRVGGDIATRIFDAAWIYVPSELRNVASRWPFCLRVLCDADPVLLRARPEEEIATGGWVMAFGGGALFLSDDLRTLERERVDWGLDADRVAAAMSGVPARPIDLFPADPPVKLTNTISDVINSLGASTHVHPNLYELPSGARVAVNTTDAPLDIMGTTIPPRSSRLLP